MGEIFIDSSAGFVSAKIFTNPAGLGLRLVARSYKIHYLAKYPIALPRLRVTRDCEVKAHRDRSVAYDYKVCGIHTRCAHV